MSTLPDRVMLPFEPSTDPVPTGTRSALSSPLPISIQAEYTRDGWPFTPEVDPGVAVVVIVAAIDFQLHHVPPRAKFPATGDTACTLPAGVAPDTASA